MHPFHSMTIVVVAALALARAAVATPVNSRRIEVRVLHVSPRGDDRFDGRCESPRGGRSGPFRTLERARDEARELRRRQAIPGAGGLTILLDGGYYRLKAPFTLGPEDSGDAGAPVRYRARPGKEVRLSGGLPLASFASVRDEIVKGLLPVEARGHVVQADLFGAGLVDIAPFPTMGVSVAEPPLAPCELFIDRQPMELAGWPNAGFDTTIAALAKTDRMVDLRRLANRFQYAGDRPRRWLAANDLRLHGYWSWEFADSFAPVLSIDPDRREITLSPGSTVDGVFRGQRWRAVNLVEELDRPGEYVIDRATAQLYVWPPAPLDRAEAVVSMLAGPVVRIDRADHVSFSGMTVEMSRGNGIEIEGASGVTLEDLVVRNTGRWGVVARSARGLRVVACSVHHTGDGGIWVEGGDRTTLTPGGNTVENCEVHHFSRFRRTFRPGIQVDGVGGRVVHNRVHHGTYGGITLTGNDHVAELNEVYAMDVEASDGGAFSTPGADLTQLGTVIRHNHVHHLVPGAGDMGLGVFNDCMQCGVTFAGNIFQRCSYGIYNNFGCGLAIEGNLFVDCMESVLMRSFRNFERRSLVYRQQGWFDQNARHVFERWLSEADTRPYFSRYPLLVTLKQKMESGSTMDMFCNTVEGNLIVRSPGVRSMADPRDNSIRGNTVTTDPRVAEEILSKGTGPISAKLGFPPIPVERIGLVADGTRTAVPPRELVTGELTVEARPVVEDGVGPRPGTVRLDLENAGDRAASLATTLFAAPVAWTRLEIPADQTSGGSRIPVALEPGARRAVRFRVGVEGPVNTLLVGEQRDGEFFARRTIEVPVDHRWHLARCVAPGIEQVGRSLAKVPARSLRAGHAELVAFRLAHADGALLLDARLTDARVARAGVATQGSCLEIVGTAGPGKPLGRVVFAPPASAKDRTAAIAPASSFGRPGHSGVGGSSPRSSAPEPPGEPAGAGSLPHRLKVVPGGWELTAIIPLSLFGLDRGARELRLEAFYGGTAAPGARPGRYPLFGSADPITDAGRFGVMILQP